MNQADLAKISGVSESFLSHILKGEKAPSERVLGDIAAALKVNRRWLKTGDGDQMDAAAAFRELLEQLVGLLQSRGTLSDAVLGALTTDPHAFLRQLMGAVGLAADADPDISAAVSNVQRQLRRAIEAERRKESGRS